jgi:hypothetical protein
MDFNQCSSSHLVHLLKQFHDRKREQTFSSPDVGELFVFLAVNHLAPSGSSDQCPIVRTVASSYSMFVLDHVCFEAEHPLVVPLPPVINDLTTPTCKDSCRQIVLVHLQPEYVVVDFVRLTFTLRLPLSSRSSLATAPRASYSAQRTESHCLGRTSSVAICTQH